MSTETERETAIEIGQGRTIWDKRGSGGAGQDSTAKHSTTQHAGTLTETRQNTERVQDRNRDENRNKDMN